MIATQTFPHGHFIASLTLFWAFFTVIRGKWLRILYEYSLLLHNAIVSAFILLIDILFTIVVGLYAVGVFGKETLAFSSRLPFVAMVVVVVLVVAVDFGVTAAAAAFVPFKFLSENVS